MVNGAHSISKVNATLKSNAASNNVVILHTDGNRQFNQDSQIQVNFNGAAELDAGASVR